MLFPNTFRYVFPTATDQLISFYPGKDFTRPSWYTYKSENKYENEIGDNLELI